jgi:hypothetical protein
MPRSRAKQGNRKRRQKLYTIDPVTNERRVLKNKHGTPITVGIMQNRGGSVRAIYRDRIRAETRERDNMMSNASAAVQSMGNFAAGHRTRGSGRGG